MTNPARPPEPARLKELVGWMPRGVGVVAIGTTNLSHAPVLSLANGDENCLLLHISEMPVERGDPVAVSILAADNEAEARHLVDDSFEVFAERLDDRPPVVPGALAWFRGKVEDTHRWRGAIWIAVRVDDHGESSREPLIAFHGGFARLPAATLTAHSTDLSEYHRDIDRIRHEVEELASCLACRVTVQALIDDALVFLAAAGTPTRPDTPSVLVGDRFPAIPPLAGLFMAWASSDQVSAWLARIDEEKHHPSLLQRLRHIRERGFSVYLHSDQDSAFWSGPGRGGGTRRAAETATGLQTQVLRLRQDPLDFDFADSGEVEWLGVPVFAADGQVRLLLGIEGIAFPTSSDDFERVLARVETTASRATTILGGRIPAALTDQDRWTARE